MTPFIDAFVASFHAPHAHMAAAKVTQLARAITVIGSKGAINPTWALNVLASLLHRFTEPCPHTLTTLHPVVLGHCLATGQAAFAAETILSRPVASVDVAVSPLRGADIIDYFYLAGLVHVQLQQWESAAEMFEAVSARGARRKHDMEYCFELTLPCLAHTRALRRSPCP